MVGYPESYIHGTSCGTYHPNKLLKANFQYIPPMSQGTDGGIIPRPILNIHKLPSKCQFFRHDQRTRVIGTYHNLWDDSRAEGDSNGNEDSGDKKSEEGSNRAGEEAAPPF
ncbi:hypothetical protein HAX54_001460, partial [Datura stramonium]|nr:hypothetical protein [Datura stramonium]